MKALNGLKASLSLFIVWSPTLLGVACTVAVIKGFGSYEMIMAGLLYAIWIELVRRRI